VFADPEKIVKQMGIFEGMRVADFGSGSGHYTLAAAELVGEAGRVYAIDIQSELLKKVKNLSRAGHKGNIEVIRGDIEKIGGTKLADNTADVVLVSNVLFQLEEKENTVKEAHRILKPKGRIAVIDWTDSFGGTGPEPEFVVTKEHSRELFESAGFVYDRDINAGSHHYGMMFKKV
jgi:ubiquinone/menaquinone biosynthesis C-methylase UbiE